MERLRCGCASNGLINRYFARRIPTVMRGDAARDGMWPSWVAEMGWCAGIRIQRGPIFRTYCCFGPCDVNNPEKLGVAADLCGQQVVVRVDDFLKNAAKLLQQHAPSFISFSENYA